MFICFFIVLLAVIEFCSSWENGRKCYYVDNEIGVNISRCLNMNKIKRYNGLHLKNTFTLYIHVHELQTMLHADNVLVHTLWPICDNIADKSYIHRKSLLYYVHPFIPIDPNLQRWYIRVVTGRGLLWSSIIMNSYTRFVMMHYYNEQLHVHVNVV